MEHLFNKKVANTSLSDCIFILFQVEVLLCSFLYPIIIVLILFERRSCICLSCGEQCNLHEIFHCFYIFYTHGFWIYAVSHKVVVDFLDPNRVKCVGRVISKCVNGCNDCIDFAELRKQIIVFDCKGKNYLLIVQKLLVPLWDTWFDKRTGTSVFLGAVSR